MDAYALRVVFYLSLSVVISCGASFAGEYRILSYSTYVGGSADDTSFGLATDSSGYAYITGSTGSGNFPALSPYQGTLRGGTDVFVTKLSQTGSALIYSTYIGGTANDIAAAIAVDSSGSAYVTGYSSSANFPTYNPFRGTNAGGSYDVFVSKLSPSGSSLVYSTYLGGSGNDSGSAIATDSSGSAYLTGFTTSSAFPTKTPYQGTLKGLMDGFVTMLTAQGSALVYSTYLGGGGLDWGSGIAVNSSGNAYVAGSADSSNFPTKTPYQGTHRGNGDAFITSFSASGTSLVFSTYLGGGEKDLGTGIALDPSGNSFVSGQTQSLNFPVLNPYQATYGGGTNDAFAAKLSPSGTSILYATYLGGGGNESAAGGIAIDSSGNAYITGSTDSANFPTSNPYQGANGGGTSDAYITELSPQGSSIPYSTYLGGSAEDAGSCIASSGGGSVYVTGYSDSGNFPVKNAYQGTNSGLKDVFVSKLRVPFSTIGMFRSSISRFYLRNSNSSGSADFSFSFGTSTDLPLYGDWDSNENTTIGIYRPSTRTFFLRNTNSGGAADMSFTFGGSGDIPVTGDWDGDGSTTIGVYRSSTRIFFLRNSNSGGSADISFSFGGAGDIPLTGDWDGDGNTTIGVYRPSTRTFFLRNTNSGGPADVSFSFGSSGDTPVTGDWNGDRTETAGVFRSPVSSFYLRNSNSGGAADISFIYGSNSDDPIRGDWDGM